MDAPVKDPSPTKTVNTAKARMRTQLVLEQEKSNWRQLYMWEISALVFFVMLAYHVPQSHPNMEIQIKFSTVVSLASLATNIFQLFLKSYSLASLPVFFSSITMLKGPQCDSYYYLCVHGIYDDLLLTKLISGLLIVIMTFGLIVVEGMRYYTLQKVIKLSRKLDSSRAKVILAIPAVKWGNEKDTADIVFEA
ncbi:Protein CBG27702 [Caenorhabditis briggsae]|uniref:Protein CBG27702 n=1 Tax=Caenorhabditis briggsae TaxID=6238 RepID=B6IJE7_CAEBR|nr:Protein CBG27702 [Caenorhabditis briggsae]CAR99981.1 Protein CBG27702 [Caenorhabditis briggsae]